MEPTRTPLRARRAAALAAVAAAAALAIPSAAGAAVTGTASGNTASLTGNADADNIVIGVTGTNLSHNLGTATGFESSIDFDSSEDGVQSLTAAAGRLTIDGGAGDDNIVGSRNVDHLIGGDGSDRITGFTGNDDVDGGDGNDVMIWNNGDGTDTNDGDDGIDETVVNGRNSTDDMTVKNITGGRVQFERADPGGFAIDMDVERLTINSAAGDDKLVTDEGVTLPTTVDAGPGVDAITTGDAGDLVQGGEGADTLDAGNGNDRVLGSPGADTMNGGAGEDTLVWNNGDGSDVINGQDGLDRIETNLGGADDVSKVKVLAGKVRYDRVNGAFGLDIASSEVLELNTFGGEDTLDVAPGVGALLAITADAGSGDDRLNGGDEADTFFGARGDDRLEPGAGADAVDGQDGADTLRVRDGAGDLARGGAGADNAQADAVDALAEVELADVERPVVAPVVAPVAPVAEADTRGTAVRVISRRITSKLKRGAATARVRVECPAAEAGGCEGTLSLLTAKAVRIGGVKVQALLGSKGYALEAGERRTLAVKLARGVARLGRRGRLALRAQTTSEDAAGNLATGASRLALKLVKKG